MSNNKFFAPSNAQIYGVAQVLGKTEYQLLDDIAQITFSTPVDVKPVLSIGQKEQHGYTYGQRLYAGTIQVPANAFPSFYQLFADWFSTIYKLTYPESTGNAIYLNVNAEDLPLFDIVIISQPETSNDLNYTNTFVYVIKNVKIIETSVDLNTSSPTSQVMLYRFAASYIGQKVGFVKLNEDNKIKLNLDDLLSVINLFDDSCNQVKFTEYAIERLYSE